jgi:hypothetical protein
MATAVVALAIALVPLIFLRPRRSDHATTQRRIDVTALKVVTVPRASEAVQQSVEADLSAFLRILYERAFVVGVQISPSPSPLSGQTARIEELFTRNAQAALRTHPDVFDAGTVFVTTGRVTFDGVVSFDRNAPRTALLHVALDASGVARGSPIRVAQTGNLLLNRSPVGWRVAGFDLKLTAANATPAPTPSRRA